MAFGTCDVDSRMGGYNNTVAKCPGSIAWYNYNGNNLVNIPLAKNKTKRGIARRGIFVVVVEGMQIFLPVYYFGIIG